MPGSARIAIGCAFAAALVDAWGNRYNLNPDGISYIEMARNALATGPHALINGLWSPGYPSLLMSALETTGAGWTVAIPALHFVNVALYAMAAGLFVHLLVSDAPQARASYGSWFGGAAFAMIALQSIGMGLLTPDVGVLLCVVASAACCIQLERSPHPWHAAVMLGVVLGVGYWMKGVLLPLNVMLIAALTMVPPRTDRARRKVAMAAVTFVAVILPLLIMVSARVGRPTPGEVGRLNYAWQTSDVTPYVGWTGDSSGRNGVPLHPPRLLQSRPRTLEFATPIHATYPLWYDPAYWYAGLRVRLNFQAQARILVRGMGDLLRVLLDEWVLIAALVAMWLTTRPGNSPSRAGRMPGLLAAWSLAAAIVYASIHVEARYLAGFLLVGVAFAWMLIARREARRGFPWVIRISIAMMALSLAVHLWRNTGGFDAQFRPDYIIAGESLNALGLGPGDRVAAIGDAFEQYAAFAAGTPIAAQVMDSAAFWAVTAPERSELERRLALVGVRALLANNVAPAMVAEGWRFIRRDDDSNLGVLMLRAP
jgi:hypothetical protein